MWIWQRIRGVVGGKREEQLAAHEEYGGSDPGEADEKYLAETGTVLGGGLATSDAARGIDWSDESAEMNST